MFVKLKRNTSISNNTRKFTLMDQKVAICETASKAVFVINSYVTTKDNYFRTTIDEACEAFNKIIYEFGYTQTLEVDDPT